MELLTIREAADRLHLSEWTIRRWVYGKRLDSVRLGRAVRIPVSAVEKKIKEGTTLADAR
jgi:excisionase family DNA binding protein